MIANDEQNKSAEHLLGDVASDFFGRLAAGENPRVEEYAEKYPEIAEQIRLTFPALELVGESLSSSGTSMSPRAGDPELTQKRIGDFAIVRELGRGGMGVVYEAQQISMGRKVALKVLPLAALARERGIQRFHNEVRAAAALDHPNIVSVYSVGEERGVHYYAMRLIRGQTLAAVIGELATIQSHNTPLTGDSISQVLSAADQQGVDSVGPELSEQNGPEGNGRVDRSPATEQESHISTARQTDHHSSKSFFRSAARLGVQAAEALQHAHDHGILHRDIKPGNFMLDAEGQLYVTDFGLARIESDVGVTMTGDLVGTLRYMSPEQALGKRVVVDHRCDIYSLGVTLYELFTLRPPFDGENRPELLRQISFEDPPKLRQINRSIPAELQTIVLKAIEKNPDQRYNTAEELADDLHAFLDDRPIKAKPPSSVQRAAKWSRRHSTFVRTAVATLAFAVAIGGGLLWRERSRTLAAFEQETVQRELAEQAKTTAEEETEKAQVANVKAEANLSAALDAVDKLLTHASDAELKEMPQAEAIRKRILSDALAFYEQFKISSGDSPEVRYRAAMVRVELGDADSSSDIADEGVYAKERAKIFVEATSELDSLIREFPTETKYRLGLAKALGLHAWRLMHVQAGEESLTQQRKRGIVLYQREKAEYDRLGELDLENDEAYQAEIFECSIDLARAHNLVGEHDLARTILGPIRERIRDQSPVPESNDYRLLLRATDELALALGSRDPERAKMLFRESIELDRAMLTQTANREFSEYRSLRFVVAASFFQNHGSNNEAERYADEAITVSNQMVRDFPSVRFYHNRQRKAYRFRGDLHFEKSEHEKAVEIYTTSFLLEPEIGFNSYTHRRRAAAYFQLGKFVEALADLRSALDLRPDDLSVFTSISPAEVAACPDQAFRDGMQELADKTIESRNKAIEITLGDAEKTESPDIASRLNSEFAKLGGLLEAMGRIAEAETAYRKGLDVAIGLTTEFPENDYYWFQFIDSAGRLIRLFNSTGRQEEGQRIIAMMIVPESSSPDVYSRRAGMFANIGDYDEARLDFQKAITPDNDSFYAHYQHALLCGWLDDRPAYRQTCSDFLEQFRESEEAGQAHFAAWTCALAPNAVTDYAPALALARVAVKESPQNQQYLGGLGAVQMRAGEYKQALANLNEAAGSDESSNTSSAYIAYFRAMTEQYLDRKDDARQSLARANELADKELSDESKPPSWNRKLTLQLLRNEAEALIGKPEASPDADSPDPPPAPQSSEN